MNDTLGRTGFPISPSTTAKVGTQRPEGAHYTNRLGDHEMTLYGHGLGSKQIRAVRQGEGEFALFVENPLILIGVRFGAAIPWTLAPFCWHLVPREERVVPAVAGSPEEKRILLHTFLVETEDGTVRATRSATLSLDFTRALNSAIQEQSRYPFDPNQWQRTLNAVRRRFPTTGAIVAQAQIRTSVPALAP